MFTIDFETRSRVDLKKSGAFRYAADPSTEILCLAYADETGLARVWIPGNAPPSDLLIAIREGGFIEAHNAGFERAIWGAICVGRYGWPPVAPKQWLCSLAKCSALALPRGLDQAGAALGLKAKKDVEGGKIMLQLCKPRKPTKANPEEWDNSPAKLARLYDYCAQDVRAEQAISGAIPPLSPMEKRIWQLDQTINARGIYIDREAVENALAIVQQATATAESGWAKLTGGAVTAPKQTARILKWLNDNGCPAPNLKKETVADLLETDLAPEVREALELRAGSSGSATSKLTAMLLRMEADNRIRGGLVYHGAATGRWAGAGLQTQNFPRGDLQPFEIATAIDLMETRDPEALALVLGPPLGVVTSCLRGMITAAPGARLLVGDFAQIEARVAAWLAGEADLVEAFRRGEDVYKPMAAKIYAKPVEEVTKTERQLGKVAVLGCQYGLGFQGFRATAKTMAGQVVSPKFARATVKAYREANPKIKAIWGELNRAAIAAIDSGQPQRVGRLELYLAGETLKIKLPNGRALTYWYPELKTVMAPWSVGFEGPVRIGDNPETRETLENAGVEIGEQDSRPGWYFCRIPDSAIPAFRALKWRAELTRMEPKYLQQVTYWGVDSVRRKWAQLRTYGGSLFENVVQAIARDFLAEAMLRVEAAGYPITMTVHDEIVAERKTGGYLREFETLLKVSPKWGAGCPLAVEVFESFRYRK